MKGIVLAGGRGTRLMPLTSSANKHMLPVYSKPMIYYSIATLMQAQIREILLITHSRDLVLFRALLGEGRKWGISIKYAIQNTPRGIGEAFLIGKDFVGKSKCALILGDNVFVHRNLTKLLTSRIVHRERAIFFASQVSDPERFGVVSYNEHRKFGQIIEKPKSPTSNWAVTGLYFYDNSVLDVAKQIIPSKRGELEITDINNHYLKAGTGSVVPIAKQIKWFDVGTVQSLFQASRTVRLVETRGRVKRLVGSPEQIAFENGWIDRNQLVRLAESLSSSEYGKRLLEIPEFSC